MDGLMFDTERIGHRGWKYGAQVLGLELPDEVIAAGRGMSVADSRAMYLERLGPEVDYDALRALRVAYADEAIARDGLPVKPGLRQLLTCRTHCTAAPQVSQRGTARSNRER